MDLRRLIIKLLFNEQFINRLSNTRPIRLLARFCASLYIEGRAIAQDPALKHANRQEIKEAVGKFSSRVSKTLKDAKDEFKSGMR